MRGANVLMGTDRDCMAWIRTYRDYAPNTAGAPAPVAASRRMQRAEAQGGESGGRRRGGREARRGRIGR